MIMDDVMYNKVSASFSYLFHIYVG